MRRIFSLLTLLGLLLGSFFTSAGLAGATSTVTQLSSPVRIMPLGDSLTYGTGSGPATYYSGYRGPLQEKLRADGVPFDFVGSLKSGTASKVDPDNSGYVGWRIDQLTTYAARWVKAAKPDLVLLMAGGNDVLQNYKLNTASERLQKLIEVVRQAAPGVKIIVATIGPHFNPVVQQRIATFNAGVENLVATQEIQYADISLAEMPRAYNPEFKSDYSWDGIHPNDSGYKKMANLWYPPLKQALGYSQ